MTGMREMTLWPINVHLLVVVQIMKHISNFGMIMEIPFPFLMHLIRTASFLLLTINPCSFKMTRGRPVGTIKIASQPPSQKVRGNC